MSYANSIPASFGYVPGMALGTEGFRVASSKRETLPSGATREVLTLHRGCQSYQVSVRGEGQPVPVGAVIALVGHANPLDGVVERACIVIGH